MQLCPISMMPSDNHATLRYEVCFKLFSSPKIVFNMSKFRTNHQPSSIHISCFNIFDHDGWIFSTRLKWTTMMVHQPPGLWGPSVFNLGDRGWLSSMVPNGGRLHDHCCCCNKPGRSKQLVYSRYGSEAAMFHTIDNEDDNFHDHDDADHDDHHRIYYHHTIISWWTRHGSKVRNFSPAN